MSREDDYRAARELAVNELRHGDIERFCVTAKLAISNKNTGSRQVIFPYMNRRYVLNIDGESIRFEMDAGRPTLPEQVVMLHYLIQAKAVPLAGEWVTFREIPSGAFYYQAFFKRAIFPLVRCFGKNAALLDRVADVIGEIVPSPADGTLPSRASRLLSGAPRAARCAP